LSVAIPDGKPVSTFPGIAPGWTGEAEGVAIAFRRALSDNRRQPEIEPP
jgi:hypothetical protein